VILVELGSRCVGLGPYVHGKFSYINEKIVIFHMCQFSGLCVYSISTLLELTVSDLSHKIIF
jgi:hypothetical protein